jgi:spore germination protein KB
MNGRISVRQLVFLQFTAIVPTMLIFLPGQILNHAGHDAPWSVLVALVGGIGVSAFLAWALVPYPPPRLFRAAWGPRGGIPVTLAYCLVLALGLVAVWAEFLILMRAEVLPLTPSWATGILAGVVAGVLVTGGATGIARVNDLITPLTLVVVAALVVAASLQIQSWNVLPWYPLNPVSMVKAAWLPLTFLGEIPLGAAFLGPVRRTPAIRLIEALSAGSLAAGIILLISVLLTLGVLGPQVASHLSLPFFEVIASVRIGDFLTKNAIWLIAVGSLLLYLKMAIWVYAIADALRAAFRRGARSFWAWGVIAVTLTVAVAAFSTAAAGTALVTRGWAAGAFPALVVIIGVSGLVRRRRQAALAS